MDDVIYKVFNKKSSYQLFVKDRINFTNHKKNKILFQIDALSPDNYKVNSSVVCFMDIEGARYLCHLIIANMIPIEKGFRIVRGKSGLVRSFTLMKEHTAVREKIVYYYNIKIDEGTGTPKVNGFTSFQKQSNQLFFSISIENTIKMAMAIKERILFHYMSDESSHIFKRVNARDQLQLFIKDKIVGENHKILFQIDLLTITNKVKLSVNYFMDIDDAKYLCILWLNNQLSIDTPYNKVRGKDGQARAITINKTQSSGSSYYTIKIGNGSGDNLSSGITLLQTVTSHLSFSLSKEDVQKLALNLQDTIMKHFVIQH